MMELPDELFDRHLEDSPDLETGSEAPRAPSARPSQEARPSSDLPPLFPPDGEEDQEWEETEEEDGSEDAQARSDGPAQDESEDSEESEDEESGQDRPRGFLDEEKLSKEDLQLIRSNPSLQKAYRSMQADYTRKTQELSVQRKEIDQVRQEADTFRQDYLSFRDELQSDEGMEQFLLKVALNRPEVFQKAYDQGLDLNEDEGRKELYLQKNELEEREKRLRQEEQARERQRGSERTQEIVRITRDSAKEQGLRGAEIALAEEYVANRIWEARQNGGAITDEQVREAVGRAASAVMAQREEVRKQVERELRQKNLQTRKREARDARRPLPPRDGASAPPPERQRTRTGPPEDPLTTYLNQRLGIS